MEDDDQGTPMTKRKPPFLDVGLWKIRDFIGKKTKMLIMSNDDPVAMI